MHPGAFNFVAYVSRCVSPRRKVCEFGSRDVNGSVRALFAAAQYIGIDSVAGPGVDAVGDAATWKPDPFELFDLVISTETLEHAAEAGQICRNAYELLEPGGVFVVTAASTGRAPHSAIDGGQLRHAEFYRNVSPVLLRDWLEPFTFVMIDTGNATDVYALAVK